MATPHATFTHIAQQATAQIGFTVRRWWRDKMDPSVRILPAREGTVSF